MIKKVVCLLFSFVILFGLFSCKKNNSGEIKKDLFALDTYITFTIHGGTSAQEGLDAAIDRLKEIEQRMSATIEESDISIINQNAGMQPVKVHEDTFFVIKKALEYAELTNGAFDITMLPIGRLWDITSENPKVPTKEAIEEKLKLVDYKKVQLDEENLTVYLEMEGMMIDLGGIAKGYVGDEMVRILKEYGIKNALINLGGDIVVIDSKADGTPWRIGIQKPREDDRLQSKKHVSIITAQDEAIVTSGDYERYMVEVLEKTGIRYHHIFDPKTGYPAETGLISVTVVGKNAIDVDALSTSIFIMGLEPGLDLANSLEDINVMLITEDKDVYFSQGFSQRVSVEHPDYNIKN